MTLLTRPLRRTIPRHTDLPFNIRVQRGELVWSTIAGVMAVSVLMLFLYGLAITRG